MDGWVVEGRKEGGGGKAVEMRPNNTTSGRLHGGCKVRWGQEVREGGLR